MPKWPVTVALTDGEAEAVEALADARFDGDRDAAVQSLLESWLDERGRGTNRFRR